MIFLILLLFLSSCASVVILKDPLTSQEHTDLGYIYERQGKLELAEEEYRKAIRKDRKNWLAYYNLGNIYARREDWNRAEEFYKKALELSRDPDLLNNLAYVLNRKGENCQALRLVKEAMEKGQRQEYFQTMKGIEEEISRKRVDCLSFEGERELW
ncbi:MAG: tetratricopeptide repeat protein [Aquificaceae bacterium]|jgi:Flp pilus assembly protein TadD|uniref:tetratricopeptide repeat protein n=1 Tax=Hydrogenobacter sp. Uz 6-8 TaxID=3384828 RepID=UPI000F0FC265|nr:MAG: tetratricopeptide repeat protein [Aquificota bacterium]